MTGFDLKVDFADKEHEKRFHGSRPNLVELEEKIQDVDTQIDELVYGLYGLTEKERKIIEGALL
ncbi:hypothetical protein [Methanothermobacter tenebrarum]|jgi:hypothetical protein|uniref:hypothetical protein n=1 Tax=Methanothermobacter tenebrarum TaxID=680118 RepID=UPI00199F53D9|nr:hypothetical protein [Methanothermobacter tenebrarum]MBC7128975.1 hypothetical protein [Thermoplasmatales archaeon]